MRASIVLIALLSGAAAVAQPAATIELRNEVQVAGPTVRLGDIAVLRSDDLGLMRALVDLPVGPSPAAGRSMTTDRTAIDHWVRRKTGIAAGQLAWSGPAGGRITAALRLVRGEEIEQEAHAALRGWLAARSVRSEVETTTPPRDLEAPAGTLRLKVRPLAQAALRERMVVWVEVWAAERFVRAVPVAFHVAAWQERPVALAPLVAGAALRDASWALREVDVAAAGHSLAIPASGEGLRLRRPVPPGVGLNLRDLEAMPAVVRGQWVSLRSGAGAVLTEARVEALQDGRVGERVRVRPSGAAAPLVAVVTGPGQLEVAR